MLKFHQEMTMKHAGHCNLAFHDTCQNYMSNLIKGNKYEENMKIHQKFINRFVRLVFEA